MMHSTATAPTAQAQSLPALVARAAETLANARTAAEVLEAGEMASFAYDVAKRLARFAKAKGAHDALVAAAHRTQADALEIEAMAKRRLADEYDAAQERGEVGQRTGRPKVVPDGNDIPPAAADLGLSRKDIHEARQIRDAEQAEPGIIGRTLQICVAKGTEPTRSVLRKVVSASAGNGSANSRKGNTKKKAKRGRRHEVPAPAASQHERDLELIRSIWAGISQSAQCEFMVAASEDLTDFDTICAVLRAVLNRRHPKDVATLLVDIFSREFARAVADTMTEEATGREARP